MYWKLAHRNFCKKSGVGFGVLVGGVLAENFNYHWSFWAAWIVNVLGVVGYYAYVRGSFLRNKLR